MPSQGVHPAVLHEWRTQRAVPTNHTRQPATTPWLKSMDNSLTQLDTPTASSIFPMTHPMKIFSCQSKTLMARRGDYLLRCIDHCKEPIIMKNQVNMTPSNDTNKPLINLPCSLPQSWPPREPTCESGMFCYWAEVFVSYSYIFVDSVLVKVFRKSFLILRWIKYLDLVLGYLWFQTSLLIK